ncbi:MAG: hypothetical protein KF878_17380 [Planctomycetes bacterium]|nr:hypothetical protein [Planctomycetota bacterium]
MARRKAEKITFRDDGAQAGALWTPAFREDLFQLRQHLVATKKLGSQGAFDRVRDEAARILGQCLPPTGSEQGRSTGLAIGYVQSGKTLSMTVLTELARSNGFRVIIVLAGTTKNLFKQSRERFEGDLGAVALGRQRYRMFANPAVDTHAREFEALVEEWSDDDFDEANQLACFVCVMKQHQHLEKLRDLLESVDLSRVSCLVIDDEADQAGLNNKPLDPQPSTTYRRIREIRDQLPRHTYVQYTATPQAPLLISLVDMLSPDFAELLGTGDGYTGGRAFFVQQSSLIKIIPPSEFPDQLAGSVEPPASLLEAMRIYFIGATASRVQNKADHRSMLIHPSFRRPYHTQYEEWVTQVTKRWRSVLRSDDDEERDALLEEFKQSYAVLKKTVPDIPAFEDIAPKLKIDITRAVIKTVNGDALEEVDWKANYRHILVGGTKLDRGYTVQGLTVSYMPRGAGTWNADTIQQRARWFGYKGEYLGYCRVYLPQDLADAYSAYVEHEEHVRAQLERHRGRSLRDWRRAFYLEMPMRPTRQNVLLDPYVHLSDGATWFKQREPHFSAEAVERNRSLVSSFTRKLKFVPIEAHNGRHSLVRLPLKRVFEDFLAQYGLVGSHDGFHGFGVMCRLVEHLRRDGDAKCAFYLMGNGEARDRRTSNDLIDNLHQGRDPRRRNGYPGDAAIHDPDVVTVQLYTVNVLDENGSTTIMPGVPAIAIHLPRHVADGDLVIQPRAGQA